MSTTPVAPHAACVAALERVGAALVEARDAVLAESQPARPPQDALVALCRTAYDALVAWEGAEASLARDGIPDPTLPHVTWRTALDELRVQSALAEMELRDVRRPLPSVHDLTASVTQRLSTARRDVGAALDGLRSELRRLSQS